MKPILLTSVLLLTIAGGCQDELRFAPSEPIQQTGEINYELAVLLDAEGAEPGSPATRALVESSKATHLYLGRPDAPPDPEQIPETVTTAQSDAVRRPDPWKAADSILALALGVSGLFGGGVGATKLTQYLKQLQAKKNALEEVVKGNEIFKRTANGQSLALFKESHNLAQLTPGTRRIVSDVRSTLPTVKIKVVEAAQAQPTVEIVP
jgi:hypothetical protein